MNGGSPPAPIVPTKLALAVLGHSGHWLTACRGWRIAPSPEGGGVVATRGHRDGRRAIRRLGGVFAAARGGRGPYGAGCGASPAVSGGHADLLRRVRTDVRGAGLGRRWGLDRSVEVLDDPAGRLQRRRQRRTARRATTKASRSTGSTPSSDSGARRSTPSDLPQVLTDFRSPLPNETPATDWTRPQYYSTIQAADLDGQPGAEILARFADGMHVYKYVPPAGTNAIDGGSWRHRDRRPVQRRRRLRRSVAVLDHPRREVQERDAPLMFARTTQLVRSRWYEWSGRNVDASHSDACSRGVRHRRILGSGLRDSRRAI